MSDVVVELKESAKREVRESKRRRALERRIEREKRHMEQNRTEKKGKMAQLCTCHQNRTLVFSRHQKRRTISCQ